MKVITEGSLTKTATCKRCKSKLEYEPSDVKSTTYTDGDTISHISRTIDCPLCLKKLGQNYCSIEVERI